MSERDPRGTALVAVTFIRPYTDKGSLDEFQIWKNVTPESFGASVFYRFRDEMRDGQFRSFGDLGWLAGEVQLIEHADSDTPQVTFQRLYNWTIPLRDIPLAPATVGTTADKVEQLVELLRRAAAMIPPDSAPENVLIDELVQTADDLEKGRDAELLALTKHLKTTFEGAPCQPPTPSPTPGSDATTAPGSGCWTKEP